MFVHGDDRDLEKWASNAEVRLVPVIEQRVEEKALFGILRVWRRPLDVGMTPEHKSRMKSAPNAFSPKKDSRYSEVCLTPYFKLD